MRPRGIELRAVTGTEPPPYCPVAERKAAEMVAIANTICHFSWPPDAFVVRRRIGKALPVDGASLLNLLGFDCVTKIGLPRQNTLIICLLHRTEIDLDGRAGSDRRSVGIHLADERPGLATAPTRQQRPVAISRKVSARRLLGRESARYHGLPAPAETCRHGLQVLSV